jgi:acetylornithine/succinyldiaminopimelate/putrescine aminotransferase
VLGGVCMVGTTMLAQPLTTDFLMVTARRPAAVMTKGRGSRLSDSDGNSYLDFVQGWAVNCLGHSPAVIAEAISRQASELLNSPARRVSCSTAGRVFSTHVRPKRPRQSRG